MHPIACNFLRLTAILRKSAISLFSLKMRFKISVLQYLSELICSLSIYNKNSSKEEFFMIDSSVTFDAFKRFVKNNYTQTQEIVIKASSGKIISSTSDLHELFTKSAKNRQVCMSIFRFYVINIIKIYNTFIFGIIKFY